MIIGTDLRAITMPVIEDQVLIERMKENILPNGKVELSLTITLTQGIGWLEPLDNIFNVNK